MTEKTLLLENPFYLVYNNKKVSGLTLNITIVPAKARA